MDEKIWFEFAVVYLIKFLMRYTYILKCADDSLYTGVTTDLERRVAEHNADPK